MAIPREQFKEAYGKLPEPIRAYLAGEELGLAVEQIGSAHGLHVDAIGVLAEILTRTLLGLISPQELPAALTNSLGIDAQKANAILTSTNEQIFIPLQKQVREAAERETQDRALEERLAEIDRNSSEPLPIPEQRPEPIPPPKLAYEPPVTQAPPTLPGSPVAAPMPQEPAPPASEPTALPALATNHLPVQAQQHVVAAPAGHHPGWHPAAAVHIFVPSQQPHQAPVPVATAPVQEPVSSIPVVPVQQAAPAPTVQPAPRPAPPPPPATPAPAHPYSADPYREPI